jgi:hypothetical protein
MTKHPAAPRDRAAWGVRFAAIAPALPYVAAAATVASTAVAAYGAVQQGQSQAEADRYNRQLQQQEAEVATQQAEAQVASDKQLATRQMGEIAASYGASGVDVGQGSPLEVLSDQAAEAQIKQNIATYRARVAATGDVNSANLYGLYADQARQAALARAGSTILTGASQIARDWPFSADSSSHNTTAFPFGKAASMRGPSGATMF